jgi:hypothetical protein
MLNANDAAPSAGTYVSVHGRVGNDSATQVAFALDGAAPVLFAAPAQSSAGVASTQPLFQSAALAQGRHTIVATAQYAFSSFVLPPPSFPPSPLPPPPPLADAPHRSGTLWVDYLLVQPNPSTNTTLPAAPRGAVGVGAIAGAAGGALALVVGVVLLVLFRRRVFAFARRGRKSAAPAPARRPDLLVSSTRVPCEFSNGPGSARGSLTTICICICI